MKRRPSPPPSARDVSAPTLRSSPRPSARDVSAPTLRSSLRPSARDVSTTHVEVRPCAEGVGRGLFATRKIAKGNLVARMHSPRDATATLARRYHEGLPGGDAAIAVGKALVTSSGFKGLTARGDYTRAPRWYRMNHSDSPNTRLQRDAIPDGLTMAWYAIRDIERGEALTWHYGKRDPAWPRGSAYCKTSSATTVSQ